MPGFAEALAAASQKAGPDARRNAMLPGRFRDNGELRYSLRALERFAPWVRHIHIATNGQFQPWLDTNNPRLKLVRHEQIFEPGQLPTFNSMALESRLHEIPGLADFYLYFNDDVFLCRPLQFKSLLAADGLPRSSVVPFRSITATSRTPTHRRPARLALSAAILTARLGQRRWRDTPHTPMLFHRPTVLDLVASTPELGETANHRVRQLGDVSLRFLHVHTLAQQRRRMPWAWLPGPFDTRYSTAWPREARLLMAGAKLNLRALRAVERRPPRVLCVNDDMGHDTSAFEPVRAMLQRMFPEPSSFERAET